MAFQWFVRIDGVVGGSKVVGHEGEIEADSVAWGVTQSGGGGFGGGGGAGKPNVEPLAFTAHAGQASPPLLRLVTRGEHVRQVRVSADAAGERPRRVIEILLEDVTLTGWHIASDDQGKSDAVSLQFGKVTYSFFPQNPDGTPGSPVVATWDVRNNRS